MSTTTYSMTDLRTTARWTLRTHNCPACCVERRNKALTLKDWYVQLETGKDARLGVVGECKQHRYSETHFCLI